MGAPVARLLERSSPQITFVGSILLIPELLTKPTRLGYEAERKALVACLSRLTLIAVDGMIAELATTLGATYGLKPLDAIHLATAVHAEADLFVTNNRKHFDRHEIVELEVVYPDRLG